MYGEPKTIKVIQDEKDRENFNVVLLGKMILPITDDEARSLMWELADLLGYETRSKW